MTGSRLQMLTPGPALGGVASYARRLDHSLESSELLFADRETRTFVDPISTEQRALDADSLVVHFEGYGMARWGAPGWITDALAHWRRARPRGRLVVFFHELDIGGRPFGKAWMVSCMQRRVLSRVARMADAVLCARTAYARRLAAFGCAPARIHALPICSTIGEPTEPRVDRRDTAIVFGTAGRRRAVYRSWSRSLDRILSDGGVREILDAGEGAADFPESSALRFTRFAGSEDGELLEAIGGCLVGILSYPPSALAKSSVFAAYAACGTAPLVLPEDSYPAEDGLAPGIHFFSPESGVPNFREIGASALQWYAGHAFARHLDLFLRSLPEAA